jgi:hypothetical protein
MITTSPALGQDGTSYFVATDARLHALDGSGTQRWATPMGMGYDASSPAVGPSGTIYFLSSTRPAVKLTAVHPNGFVAWTVPLSGPLAGAVDSVRVMPVIADDETIYVTGEYSVYAFSPDGTPKWDARANSNAPVALGRDGTIYAAGDSFGDTVHAIRPDGTQRWSALTVLEFGPVSPLVGTDGVVYVLDGDIRAFSPEGGRLGSRSIGSLAVSRAALVGDFVFFSDVRNDLRAMRLPSR